MILDLVSRLYFHGLWSRPSDYGWAYHIDLEKRSVVYVS
jgi:hypothetical protein